MNNRRKRKSSLNVSSPLVTEARKSSNEKLSQKRFNDIYEEYVSNSLNSDKMISVLNFSQKLRGLGWKRADYIHFDEWTSMKEELDEMYESFLITHAVKGQRHCLVYTQLLDKHLRKKEKLTPNVEKVKIELDFKNNGVNKI